MTNTPRQPYGKTTRARPMPRPHRPVPPMDLIEPLRTVEDMLAHIYWTMGKSNQRRIGDKIREARELVRQANDLYLIPPAKGESQ